MSKGHLANGRSAHDGAFIKLPFYLFDSFAWTQLSITARCAWTEIVRLHNGSSNGRLAVPVRALADKLDVSHVTASRALKELAMFGFIEIAKPSSFSRKRLAAEYRLTHLPCTVTGELPTKAFMKIGNEKPD